MRLIDADALKEVFKETDVHYGGKIKEIIDNAPTVETDIKVVAKDAYKQGYTDGWKERFGEPNERTQGDLADEVWKLYEKYHSHLATHVIEFGDELKDLLGKYQKGGTDMRKPNYVRCNHFGK